MGINRATTTKFSPAARQCLQLRLLPATSTECYCYFLTHCYFTHFCHLTGYFLAGYYSGSVLLDGDLAAPLALLSSLTQITNTAQTTRHFS